ncbi:MAG: hypothetical protein RL172_2798 [Bacteroidota bacterium]|jgi:hypothetical protein
MRKLAAIFMLSVFTFNIAGYQWVYQYLANQSDAALENALDKQTYNEANLISIKQPANLPYYTNNKNFQRIDGEVEINGVAYKYVKCRIYNDSLEMLCIPNHQKMQIIESKNTYAKIIHDFQQSNTKKKSADNTKSFQKILSDYEVSPAASINADSYLLTKKVYVLVNSVLEKNAYINPAEQPPDQYKTA